MNKILKKYIIRIWSLLGFGIGYLLFLMLFFPLIRDIALRELKPYTIGWWIASNKTLFTVFSFTLIGTLLLCCLILVYTDYNIERYLAQLKKKEA